MVPNLKLKLRIPTWIGLAAVLAALLYCNLVLPNLGRMQDRAARTTGWPFIYWIETTRMSEAYPGMLITFRVSTEIRWAAVPFNLLATAVILAAVGLTIERFMRAGATHQFSLSSIFTLTTVVAITFGLCSIESLLFHHTRIQSRRLFEIGPDGNILKDIEIVAPWPIRVIILFGIAATLLLAVRGVFLLVWSGVQQYGHILTVQPKT